MCTGALGTQLIPDNAGLSGSELGKKSMIIAAHYFYYSLRDLERLLFL